MLLVSATAVSCTGVTAPAVVPVHRHVKCSASRRRTPVLDGGDAARLEITSGPAGPHGHADPARPVLITEGRVQTSGPELALQGGGGLLESARVGAGREVL